MLLTAFVVDFGRQYAAKAQMQNAVDSAALASAQLLCSATTDAPVKAEAQSYAGLNEVTITTDDVTVDRTSSLRTVRVAATGSVGTLFGQFAGVSSLGVSAEAVAGKACGIRRFGLYGDDTVTLNGSNQEVAYLYSGEGFGSTAQGNKYTFVEVDPEKLITINNASVPPETIKSYIGERLSAQAYAEIFPTEGAWCSGKYVDVTSESKFDDNVQASCVDEKSDPSGAFTSCGTNSNTTGGALNLNKSGRFVCTASSVVTNGLQSGFMGIISSTLPINLGGSGGGAITFNPKLLYSSASGTAISLNGVNMTDPETIIYAPNGAVVFGGNGNSLRGTVIAKSITFNGAKQLASKEGEILPNPGSSGNSVTLLQ